MFPNFLRELDAADRDCDIKYRQKDSRISVHHWLADVARRLGKYVEGVLSLARSPESSSSAAVLALA